MKRSSFEVVFPFQVKGLDSFVVPLFPHNPMLCCFVTFSKPWMFIFLIEHLLKRSFLRAVNLLHVLAGEFNGLFTAPEAMNKCSVIVTSCCNNDCNCGSNNSTSSSSGSSHSCGKSMVTLVRVVDLV